MPDMLSHVPTANPVPPSSNSYDDVPYESHPFAQTHPSRLFTVGTLFGLRPVPPARCRVLELGCAGGGNLLPMAEALPEGKFVGVDLSARQIADGLKVVDKLGLKNLTLKHASILDVNEEYGEFDYIVCHGVFSWVPTQVQDKILDICSKQLNPNGIAYISYNTYPGWHMRGMIRDMMRYHAGRFNTPQLRTQQARALLNFLAENVRQDSGAYASLLKSELETLRHQADHYLYHEHLEEVNDPLYFHQFAERAKAKGLKYLGESRIGTMVTGNFGPEIEKTLKMLATDQIQAEQYMDFLRNRMFRETLLVPEKALPNWAINPESLRALHVASAAVPAAGGMPNLVGDENVSYRGPSGMTMATNRPILKAAMQILQFAFPGTVPFDQLRKQAQELLQRDPNNPQQAAEDTQVIALGILNCYMGSDLMELHGHPVNFCRTPGEKPTAFPLARLQASNGWPVANRRHEVVRLNELDKHLIPLLDGTRDRAALIEKVADIAARGGMNVHKDGVTLYDPKEIQEALKAVMDQALSNIARLGILMN